MQTISVHELAELIQKGKDAAQYIDVREAGEFEIARLPHFDLLPLSRYLSLPSRDAEITDTSFSPCTGWTTTPIWLDSHESHRPVCSP